MDEPVVVRQAIVVMGVTGCGKTTIGRLLAERLGVAYAEGDSFHPSANVAKMASGQALEDEDRYPWLTAVAEWLKDRDRSGQSGVVSCSALKYHYRELLRQACDRVWFLHLDVDRELVTRRVAERSGHFMPVSLVDSQFRTLERLRPEEAGAVVDASAPADEVVRAALARLGVGHLPA